MKLILIESCDQCPHHRLYVPHGFIGLASCFKMIVPRIFKSDEPYFDGFPQWCPLEDAKKKGNL